MSFQCYTFYLDTWITLAKVQLHYQPKSHQQSFLAWTLCLVDEQSFPRQCVCILSLGQHNFVILENFQLYACNFSVAAPNSVCHFLPSCPMFCPFICQSRISYSLVNVLLLWFLIHNFKFILFSILSSWNYWTIFT